MTKELTLWSERQRLHFIERMLFWRGYINRKDLLDHFGISPPQATNDLVNYSTRNREGCQYNVRAKRYEATSAMKPVLIEPDFSTDMHELGASVSPDPDFPFVHLLNTPCRVASLSVFQKLSRAVHRRDSLSIKYWSVNSGTAEWRRISPRAFASDGLRWHVRAYCHKRKDFIDFVIGRIQGIRDPQPCEFADVPDTDWTESISLLIRPNPALDTNRQKALEMDYNMKDGVFRYTVPKAMKVYAARRLGFIRWPQKKSQFPLLNELKELEMIKEE